MIFKETKWTHCLSSLLYQTVIFLKNQSGLIVYQVSCIKLFFFMNQSGLIVYQVSCIKQWVFSWIKVDSLFIKSPVLNSDFFMNQSGLIIYLVSCIKQLFFSWIKVDSLFIKSPVLNSVFFHESKWTHCLSSLLY